jgi:hypothetical protein
MAEAENTIPEVQVLWEAVTRDAQTLSQRIYFVKCAAVCVHRLLKVTMGTRTSRSP